MTISKTGSQSTSTATSMATCQKSTRRRRKRKLENISNMTKKDILQKTVKKTVYKEMKNPKEIRQ